MSSKMTDTINLTYNFLPIVSLLISLTYSNSHFERYFTRVMHVSGTPSRLTSVRCLSFRSHRPHVPLSLFHVCPEDCGFFLHNRWSKRGHIGLYVTIPFWVQFRSGSHTGGRRTTEDRTMGKVLLCRFGPRCRN